MVVCSSSIKFLFFLHFKLTLPTEGDGVMAALPTFVVKVCVVGKTRRMQDKD